jgi:hypothetical protein
LQFRADGGARLMSQTSPLRMKILGVQGGEGR